MKYLPNVSGSTKVAEKGFITHTNKSMALYKCTTDQTWTIVAVLVDADMSHHCVVLLNRFPISGRQEGVP